MKSKLVIFSFLLGVCAMQLEGTENHQQIPAAFLNHPIKVRYTNYRGETAVRTIVPLKFEFGKTDYHPHDQWLVVVWDVDRNAQRLYALKDISQWFVE